MRDLVRADIQLEPLYLECQETEATEDDSEDIESEP